MAEADEAMFQLAWYAWSLTRYRYRYRYRSRVSRSAFRSAAKVS
jgi:hypothetical protein